MQQIPKICLGYVRDSAGEFHSYGLLVGPRLVLTAWAKDPKSLDIEWGEWSGRIQLEPVGGPGQAASFGLFRIPESPPEREYEPPARVVPLDEIESDEPFEVLWGSGRSVTKSTRKDAHSFLLDLAEPPDASILGAAVVTSAFGVWGIVTADTAVSLWTTGSRPLPEARSLSRLLADWSTEPAFQSMDEDFFPEFDRGVVADEDEVVRKAASEDAGLLPLSRDVQEVLRWVQALCALRREERSPHLILVGLLLFGRGPREGSARFLWDWITRHLPPGVTDPLDIVDRALRGPYPEQPHEFLERGFAQSLGGDRLFAAAWECAQATGSNQIWLRHLVAVYLIGPDAQRFAHEGQLIGESGIALDPLAEGFLAYLTDQVPEELGDWRSWAAGGELGTAQSAERSPAGASFTMPVTPPSRRAGFSGDAPGGPDHLDLETEVETLSSILLDRHHAPPLSIGLFGDWGAGKSFFLGKLQEEVRALTSEAREAAEHGRESVFVERAPQIEFNAWHYVDANLWASLVTHLFGELQVKLFGKRPSPEETRAAELEAQLFRDLETTRKRIEQLQQDRARADEEAGAAQAKSDAAAAAVDRERGTLKSLYGQGTELADLVFRDEEVQLQVKQVAANLGRGLESIDAARELAGDAVDSGKRWGRFLRERPVVSAAGIVALLAGAVLAGLPSARAALDGAVAWTGTLAALAAGAGPFLSKLRSYLAGADELRVAYERVQNRKVADCRQELDAAEERRRLAQEELEEERRQVRDIESRIAEAQRGIGLEAFLQERLASSQYTEQLGIVAMVRQDLETLTKRLREEGVRLPGQEGLHRVDRVVLYIDDLDRCSPERVVEVLQAVHLLLAVPLFVVVVAADPRWLLQSLRWYYAELWRSRVAGDGEAASAAEAARWSATPHQYLEKIFQIPYTLQAMGDTGYRKLVESLVGAEGGADAVESSGAARAAPDDRREPEREPEPDRPAESGLQHGGEAEPEREPGQAPVEPTGGAAPDPPAEEARAWQPTRDLAPARLRLEDDEKRFLAELAPLVATPRSTKRLVNVYRLLRANLSAERLEELRAGGFRAVQVLLGVLIGFPDVAAEYLRIQKHGGVTAGPFGGFAERAPSGKQVEWNRLGSALERLRAVEVAVLEDDIPGAERWIDEVSRYSFRAGHLLRVVEEEAEELLAGAPPEHS